MATPPALMLLLLDSRAPAGAHSHSGGMEAAVMAGIVADLSDVERFCRGRLRTSGLVTAAFAAASCRLQLDGATSAAAEQWAELDAELEARTASEAQRTASRQLGSGLHRLLRATQPDADLRTQWALIPPPAPHHALVLGAAVALAGGDPSTAARAAALATCTGPATAAVRLLGLDPYAVHGLLARLAGEIDTTSWDVDSLDPGADDWARLPANAAPALELLADVHITQEVRLFAS